ncbi:unnamed protein product [Owenia fusiformis]|nr:unnamed protein product [Owenia fusiformis]
MDDSNEFFESNVKEGEIRHLNDLSKKEVLYMVIGLLQAVLVMVVCVYQLAISIEDDFTVELLVLTMAGFCTFYQNYGTLKELHYDIFLYCLAEVVLQLMVSVGMTEWTTPAKWVRIVGLGAAGVFLVPCSMYLGSDYAISENSVLRLVGHNDNLKVICKNRQLYLATLKLDFHLSVTMLILTLRHGRAISTKEQLVLGIGIVFVIGWTLLAYLASRLEKSQLMWIFWGTAIIQPAYVIYKIREAQFDYDLSIPDSHLTGVVNAFGCFALLTRVALNATSVITYRDFDKGLKEKV